MQFSIYLTVAFLAFAAAEKLDVGPQVFAEHQPASKSSLKPDKRSVVQEYTLYLTPDEIKALQGIQSSENVEKAQSPKESQSQQEKEDDQQLKWYNSQFLPESSQLEIQAAQDAFLHKQNLNSGIQQGNYQYINLYSEETPKEEPKEIQTEAEDAKQFEEFYKWQKEQDEKIKQESNLKTDDKQKNQLEIRGLASHDIFFQKQKVDSDIQQGKYQYINLYSEEIPTEQQKEVKTENVNNFEKYFDWQKKQDEENKKQIKQEIDLQKEAKWKPFYTISAKHHENKILNEQLKQQWDSILDHNRIQLKTLSSAPKEAQELKQNEKSTEQIQSTTKSEIEKEIENILRDHRAFELSQQNGVSLAEAINKRPPILIHKEVSVTKHLPVPFVKKVKVPVPTPVLVPVPEPYQVKIPHPYPVLYKL
ncbi:probable inactive protein kinase DDB_G0270444 [Bicyclus anynana]|uniref:Probable inactive protein kinase DDB_G0270444 n=1 Tax=Bicyclus anynana TaxID=110368 RepID=A0ABM3LT85_BICAN|nr:probable inactive protein kinase DDB_G0270444 [Bicyclus anynana]